jgi:starch synthase
VFVIRGPSLETYGEGYREIARKAGAETRLILQGPVPSRDVVAAARGADAGIWTLPRLCRNFTYALPNKIFEYVTSNLPLLVADYPEARRMVEQHKIGLTFDPYDPHSIAASINRLIDEPDLAQRFRDNTHAALAAIDAEAEWQKLVKLYDALPRASGSAAAQIET